MKKLNEEQIKVLKQYATLAEKTNSLPTHETLEDFSITRKKIRILFNNCVKGSGTEKGSLEIVKRLAREMFPTKFEKMNDESLFDKSFYNVTAKEIASASEYLISSPVIGAPLHVNQYETMLSYVKNNKNAKIIIMVSSKDDARLLDKRLLKDHQDGKIFIVYENMVLAKTLLLNTVYINPMSADPIARLGGNTYNTGSVIVASPKFRAKREIVDNNIEERWAMTTGSITYPNYLVNKEGKKVRRTIATDDASMNHKNGFLFIEVTRDRKQFFHTLVEVSSDGSFFLRGMRHTKEKTLELKASLRPELYVLGDLHAEDVDMVKLEASIEVIKQMKPKKVVIHDLNSFVGISHHNENKSVSEIVMFNNGQTDLKKTFEMTVKVMNKLTALVGKYIDEVVVVRSNHDEHLDRWLEENRHMEKVQNRELGIELYQVAIKYKMKISKVNTLQYGLEKFGLMKSEKVVWLRREEFMRIGSRNKQKGVLYSHHGDIMRGMSNIKQFSKVYNNGVFGHCHSAEIYNDAWSVGTSFKIGIGDISYVGGNSTAMTQTDILVHANGQKELFNIVNGTWNKNSVTKSFEKVQKQNAKKLALKMKIEKLQRELAEVA